MTGFLQNAFLLSLAALAIPLILHLVSRWQTKTIEIGTIRFLREVMTESVHRRKIRRWLLLATRMLLFVLLAILFARPFMIEGIQRDGDRRRVILIDRSASMGMRGPDGKSIDVAIQKAIKASKELGSDAKIDWAWFDSIVKPFAIKGNEGSIFSAVQESLSGSTHYVNAITWARDRIAEDLASKSDVVIYTDLLRSGATNLGDLDFPEDVPISIVDVGRDAASNLSINRIGIVIGRPNRQTKLDEGFEEYGEASSSDRDRDADSKSKSAERFTYKPEIHGAIRPDHTIYVHSTFFNYGPMQRDDVPVVVTARQSLSENVKDATTESKIFRVKTTIDALAEQATESLIELGKLGHGQWEISVEIDVDDDLLIDNRRIYAVDVSLPPKILLVSTETSTDDFTGSVYYLNKALNQGIERDQLRFATQVVSSSVARSTIENSPGYKAIVLADATTANSELIDFLEQYVRHGGKVLAFMGHQGGELGAERWNNSPLSPGRFGSVRNAGASPFRISPKEYENAIFRPFADPQTGDLQKLNFRKAFSLVPSNIATTLASFDSDLPAFVDLSYEKGRVVWFMSDAGDAWSNWTSSPLYLPLIHQITGDLCGLIGDGGIRFKTVGDQRLVESESLRNDVIANAPNEQQFTTAVFKSPPNASKRIADESYYEKTGFIRESSSLSVVNIPEMESDTARLSESELRAMLGLPESEEVEEAIANPSGQAIKRKELWPWIAVCLLVGLVFEFGLANRTPA